MKFISEEPLEPATLYRLDLNRKSFNLLHFNLLNLLMTPNFIGAFFQIFSDYFDY